MSEKPDCLNDLDQVRDIEGFPLGTDEDICVLSDPPHYTAYPNPHIADFIAEHGTPYDEATDDYHREPFVSDVSEGKNDPIYRAHSYHTKVPYKAIVPFIEHYTENGQVILDGFSGSGMTGLAAQATGRNAILCDLAPAATFIAKNINKLPDHAIFLAEVKELIRQIRKECGWMFKTRHESGEEGVVNYAIWSEVFECPYCDREIIYADIGYDLEDDKPIYDLVCLHCGASLSKRELRRKLTDSGKTKLVPVLINYLVGKKRFKKKPDKYDIELLERIKNQEIPYWYPNDQIMHTDPPWGEYWRSGYHVGFENISDFYTKRNLWTLSTIWSKANDSTMGKDFLKFLTTSMLAMRCSLRMPYRSGGRSAGAINNLHIPSLIQEYNPIRVMERKSKAFARAIKKKPKPSGKVFVTTQSTCDLGQVPDSTLDYIFVDPPFGDNIIYTELNFLWEAWLKVFTNYQTEAIVSKFYNKDEIAYRDLMNRSFREMYRALKPNRWITVEFHNSRASIWNIIQDSLARSGFIIAQVTILDKKQGSYKQVSTPGSVKNDLIINAYKPRNQFESSFLNNAGVGEERNFLRQHLGMLALTPNVERTREMLYSKMLAYYIQRGYEISLNSAQFYGLLAAEFVERDGYWFRDEAQAQEYEQRKLDPARRKAAGEGQGVLFVTDERSAIAWLHHFLAAGPQTYSDIYTTYAKALQTSDDQIPELKQILEETCVQVNGHWKRPDALTAEELETRRRERLLRQFNDYLREAAAGQKLKDVRKEAILTGFEEAYRAKRYQDILTVGGKLNQSLIDSSTEIFDFIDIAEAKAS